MAEVDIECQMCGEHFVAKGSNALYCPKCKRKNDSKRKKTENQTWREITKLNRPLQKPVYGFVPAKCPDDCVYYQTLNGSTPMCGYFLKTDELRGCDPGLGCNKYVGLNEDLKTAKHRKTTWDVVNGKKLWEAGWKDSMIAQVMRVKTDTVRSYRKRVWQKQD